MPIFFPPVTERMYGFVDDSLVPREQINLTIQLGEEWTTFQVYIDYLIMDNMSTYNGILRIIALKLLKAVTCIHHLYVKFENEGIANIQYLR